MNSRKTNNRLPSLLAEVDEPDCGISRNIASDYGKTADRRSRKGEPKYLFVLLSALVLLIAGLIIHALPGHYRANPSSAAAPLALNAASEPVINTASMPFVTTTDLLPDISSRAVIVNEPASVEAAAAEMPTQTVTKNATKAPGSTVRITPQPALRPQPAPAPAQPQPSNDIDVLIAMMRYSEDEKSVWQIDLQQRIDQCPTANTVKGIQCRQKICAEFPRATSLCPAQ